MTTGSWTKGSSESHYVTGENQQPFLLFEKKQHLLNFFLKLQNPLLYPTLLLSSSMVHLYLELLVCHMCDQVLNFGIQISQAAICHDLVPSVKIIHLDSNYFQTGGNVEVLKKSWHSIIWHVYKFRYVTIIYNIVQFYYLYLFLSLLFHTIKLMQTTSKFKNMSPRSFNYVSEALFNP